MKREIKAKVTIETEEQLTEAEIESIKKALGGQLIKTVNSEGKDRMIVGIIEHICHVEPVHTPQTMA
jgi:hypothetical protein